MSGRRETFVSGLRYVPDYLESDTHDRLLAEVDAQPWHPVGDARRIQSDMTQNKETVERYMDGFRRSDHGQILSCLTDDVEWEIPGAFHARGKAAFDDQIENDGFIGSPAITVTRMTEDADVVVAEGFVRTQRKDGRFLNLSFCDVFEMHGGKIRRLISYLVETK